MSKLAELRAKRLEAEKLAAEKARAAIEDQLIKDEEAIVPIAVPGTKVVELNGRLAVVGKPSMHEYSRLIDSDLKFADHTTFLRSCLLYPSSLDELLATNTAEIHKLSTAAASLIGSSSK